MLLWALLREIEGELQYAVDADARHHGFLDDDLALGAGKHLAADGGILALGVLAHDPEVDVAGLAVGERCRHTRHQAHWPQVDVLVELAPELEQRAPKRDVIRDLLGPADGAEEDRIVRADPLLPVLRQHAAVLGVIIVGGKIEVIELQVEAELLSRGLQNTHSFRRRFLTDAIAGNNGQSVRSRLI